MTLRRRAFIISAVVFGVWLFAIPVQGEELSEERVLQIEQALYGLGYHGEDWNAQLDEETYAALRNFQLANGLEMTGEPDETTLTLLDSETALSCHDYLTQLAQKYADLPALEVGSTGARVTQLQNALKRLGYFGGVCDGLFGDATRAAVWRFQLANGLNTTGIVDGTMMLRLEEGVPMSWTTFLEDMCPVRAERSIDVLTLQRRLKQLGYFTGGYTGVFGEQTRRAVMLFQSNNGLNETGIIDVNTCALLYAGNVLGMRNADTLYPGDSGEEVIALQQLLAALGYFEQPTNGNYGLTTQTAVRLFQMANNLPFTGTADAATRNLLSSNRAIPLEDVREIFQQQVRTESGMALTAIGSVAEGMLGQPFVVEDEGAFDGFAFVQYACVAAGLPVTTPEDILDLIDQRVKRVFETGIGELLSIRTTDAEGNVQLRFAIATGHGCAAYATHNAAWVLQSPLNLSPETEIYRWAQ